MRRSKQDRLKDSLIMVKIMAGEDVKPKTKRKTGPRGPYKRDEDEIRTNIIKELRKKGITVKRIENSIGGRSTGIPDLWVADRYTRKAGWMEVKTATGVLSKGKDSQEEFREDCLICHVRHWVVRSVDEAVGCLRW